jgi:hypothetical protein
MLHLMGVLFVLWMKFKLSSDSGNSVSKKIMRKAIVRSGGVCIWQESGLSRHEDVFRFNLLPEEIL